MSDSKELLDSLRTKGQIWEAAMTAGVWRASNLCAVIDCNGLQAQGRIPDRLNTSPLADKVSVKVVNASQSNS